MSSSAPVKPELRTGEGFKARKPFRRILTLEELNATGFVKHKRGYWVIESRLHHALDVTLGEDTVGFASPTPPSP